MWRKIRQYIADHPDLFGSPINSEDLRAILFSRQGFRRAGRQRLTWMVFHKGESAPLVVVRHYASSRWNDLIITEHKLCSDLWTDMGGQLIPQPLAIAEIGGVFCFFERGIDGIPLSTELGRRSALVSNHVQLLPLVEDHLSLAYNCINRLNMLSRSSEKADLKRDIYSIYIQSRYFLDRISPDDSLLLDASFALLHRIIEVEIESRWRIIHRDFVPSNILRSSRGTFLVDWEYHEASTLWILEPLKFVYWYLVDLAKYVYKMDLQLVFEKYLQDSSSDLLLSELDAFLIKCGIPVDDPALKRAAWLLYFMSECGLVLSVARERLGFSKVFLNQFRQVMGHEWLERAKSIYLLAEREREVEG
ncbi:MAG: hypothetical protein QW815_03235, partial [Nitrososphaerota archaeon]